MISFRPLRRMVRVRVVEPYDVFSAFAAFALYAHQLLRIDVVAIMRRIGARVTATCRSRDHAAAVIFKSTKKHAAAFVRISLFPMFSDGVVIRSGELKHTVNC